MPYLSINASNPKAVPTFGFDAPDAQNLGRTAGEKSGKSGRKRTCENRDSLSRPGIRARLSKGSRGLVSCATSCKALRHVSSIPALSNLFPSGSDCKRRGNPTMAIGLISCRFFPRGIYLCKRLMDRSSSVYGRLTIPEPCLITARDHCRFVTLRQAPWLDSSRQIERFRSIFLHFSGFSWSQSQGLAKNLLIFRKSIVFYCLCSGL
ncbi:hypothetical protein Bind_3030 [Beijerinckia indica subsp. indica ATCC 9039]|uniref:Uncharacterized protein n=1 Tax=Beijerinckia indica subsp. indica (strain ATCC 9039 / DSM 1715 / NCIMB 8712) TaxID=395963 RepID=B2IBG6_BEII9|nr:hypothetical protein Bind_3030 [Beijerinckia indica subsp. indica ATCC 9039]